MKKILVIEDNEYMLKMMFELLTRNGYEVVTACDGIKGMKAYHAHQPELVITDIIMPDKEGLEVIMDLNKLKPEPKIIAISGGGMMEPKMYLGLAEKLGAHHTLAKPYRPAQLLALVKELLDD